MLKNFTHESKIPECCRRCFYIRKASKNSKFKRCSLMIAMPVKKKSCAKQKDSVIYLFWKFLKERGVLKEYVDLFRKEKSATFLTYRPIKNPFTFIEYAFRWPERYGNWYEIDSEWRVFLDSNFKLKNGEWRPK